LKNFISLLDISGGELKSILDRADQMEILWKANDMPQILKNRQVGMWFYGQGFRNRAAFEIGARAMGASVTHIPGEIGVQEPLEDIGRYLDNWFDVLIIRARRHGDLLKIAETTGAAVINARTDFNHPCEIIGDLQFIRRHRGGLSGLSLVFVGEVSNLCMSWLAAAVKLPITVTQVAPEGYALDGARLKTLNNIAAGRIEISRDLRPALDKADVVYTDCWPKTDTDEEADKIKRLFLPYQINAEKLSKLHDKAAFLPCPPVTRGQEVSADAMLSPFNKNHEAKQDLRHSENAVLEFAAGG